MTRAKKSSKDFLPCDCPESSLFFAILSSYVVDVGVVAVVVVVVQIVGTISRETLAYTTVCAHLNCERHRWLLPVNSDIWRLFCRVFVQAILERVHCSAGYNFIWQVIPGSCYFNWVKVLGNLCTEMFYNEFCSVVSCSVIKVVIEEPSCTGRSESIQVFKTSISCPRSLLCARLMRSTSWIRWWQLLFLISGIIFSSNGSSGRTDRWVHFQKTNAL